MLFKPSNTNKNQENSFLAMKHFCVRNRFLCSLRDPPTHLFHAPLSYGRKAKIFSSCTVFMHTNLPFFLEFRNEKPYVKCEARGKELMAMCATICFEKRQVISVSNYSEHPAPPPDGEAYCLIEVPS